MSDDQKLWELLGRAPAPKAPPFFASKVMRTLAQEESPQGVTWLAPWLRWLAPAGIAALFVFALLPHPTTNRDVALPELTTLDLVEIVNPTDYQILVEAGWPYDNGFLTASL